MRRSQYAPDMDVSVSMRGVRIALTTAAVVALTGSGFAFGRATSTCSITVTRTAPAAPGTVRPSPTASPTTDSTGALAALTTHSRTGAAVAATAMATLLSGPSVTQANAYRAAVASIAAPAHRDRDALLARADQLVAAVDAQLGTVSASAQGTAVVVRTVPVSWNVDSYTESAATVRVWAVGLVGEDGGLPATAVWATGTLDIEWTAAGWRLDDVTTVSGPVPQAQQQSTVTAAMAPELGSFAGYSYAPAP